MTDMIDTAIAARVAALIPDGHRDLWQVLSPVLVGAPLEQVTSQLQEAAFADLQDRELLATSRACGIVLAELTPPTARGLAEIAEVIGAVSVVAGAARWTAAAIAAQIQRVRDRRRQEAADGVQRTDLIELY